MKIYIKPSTETVDPELMRDITYPDVHQSQYGDGNGETKGTDNWETEEYDDSGFDW